jgi:hypothetical protein
MEVFARIIKAIGRKNRSFARKIEIMDFCQENGHLKMRLFW